MPGRFSVVCTGVPTSIQTRVVDEKGGLKPRGDRNKAGQEENSLFVEEQQSDVVATAIEATPWRECRNIMLGLFMTTTITVISLGGCYAMIANLPILGFAVLVAPWYFTVHTVAWLLLGKMYYYQVSILPSRQRDAAVFVDAVKYYTTIWNCVLVVSFGIAMYIVGEVPRFLLLDSIWLLCAMAWFFLGVFLGALSADALGITK